MFTIVGSGFGLYGYLPALFAWGESRAVLPRRYRETVMGRAELAGHDGRIDWVEDREAALDAASGVIIAARPADQPVIARACLARPGIAQLVLEKPVAPDPAAAALLLSDLLASGRRFRFGYLFLFSPVQQALRAATQTADGEIVIGWDFMAHHFAHGLDNWKRHSAQGGGAVRFYGIHLIAALADCGYDTVISSQILGAADDQIERWEASFSGPGLPSCTLALDSRAARSHFDIAVTHAGRHQLLMAQGDPFDVAAGGAVAGQDRRVGFLTQLLRSLALDDAPFHDLYACTNRLWADVETNRNLSAAR